MDVRFINPFVNSISNTFETMCGQKVGVGKPSVKDSDGPRSDVSSIIGFSGDATGAVVLHFSFDVASKIASAFACEEITPSHPDFADAVGELANMVAGGAKSQLTGFNINISLPSVVCGENHNMPASKAAKRLLIPCTIEAGEFVVEVGMVVEAQTASKTAQTAGASS